MDRTTKSLSLLDVCFSTVKTAIGIGLLYLPSQLAKTGYIGVLVIFSFGILSSASLYVCSRTAETCGKYNYLGLGEKTIGSFGKWLVFISFVVYIGGTCLIYFGTLVLYIMHLTELFFPFLQNKKWFELTATLFVLLSVFMLSLIKNTRFLAKLATAGFVGILYTTAILLVNFFAKKDAPRSYKKTGPSLASVTSFFSSVGFSYSNQFTYIAGIKELSKKTSTRKNLIILISGLIETITYIVFACAGYYLFPEIASYSPADILSVGSNSSINDSTGKPAIVNSPEMAVCYQIGVGVMFLVILFSFPLFLCPMSEMLLEAMPCIKPASVFSHLLNALLCFLFSIVSLLVDVNQIDNMLKYVSGFIGGFLCFILPATFFFKTELSSARHNAFDFVLFLIVFLTGCCCIIAFFLSFV